MNVLLILGHPRTPSLCSALAAAYCQGAQSAGQTVEAIDLGAMRFDPDVHTVSPRDQSLEPDLERARQLIGWANHLVFVYPGWWGVGPARLKAFLDRVLLPGFAFREREDGRLEGMLMGRTAHLITTLDMPAWVYRWIYRAPGHNAMKRSALGFCGVETTRILSFGPVRESSEPQRTRWLEKTRQLGFSLQRGSRSLSRRFWRKVVAWLKAFRLQFYPMSWTAYSVGALGAAGGMSFLDISKYWLGYGVVFFGKAASVFTNERFDIDSDRRNWQAGPFNGGSRVLVNGELSMRELHLGIFFALAIALVCSALLLDAVTGLPIVVVLAVMFVLGPAYTAPPLKLSWRGLGELNVAITHSLLVILFGYLLQGGRWSAGFPWLVSLPLLLATLPAILLSGVPDRLADLEAGKKTLPVRIGNRNSLLMAAGLAIMAALAVVVLQHLPAIDGAFDSSLLVILPHALLLIAMMARYWYRGAPAVRINGLMTVALAYIVWFGLFPLINLW